MKNETSRAVLNRSLLAAVVHRRDKSDPAPDISGAETKSARAIEEMCLKLVSPSFNFAGQSDAYVHGAWEAAVLPLLEEASGRKVAPPASAPTTPDYSSKTSTSQPTSTAGDSRYSVRDALDRGVNHLVAEQMRLDADPVGDARRTMIKRYDEMGGAKDDGPMTPDESRAAMIARYDTMATPKARS